MQRGRAASSTGGSATKATPCTLIPDAATRPIPWPAALWWLLLLAAPAVTLAAIRPKSRNH